MIDHRVVTQILKQLPPSASQLRCLDIGDQWQIQIANLRPDVLLLPVSVLPEQWQVAEATIDAVIAYDMHLSQTLLAVVLRVLRTGGRFIAANPHTVFDARLGTSLTEVGFVRLLIEPLDTGTGTLLRGERLHTTQDTHVRIQQTAQADADTLTLATYRGRFVHLLVRQTPDKPIWKLTADDRIEWHALTSDSLLLAFTSLPKAVAFMQAGVMSGRVRDVNKVAKFRREIAQDWPLLLNPTLAALTLEPFEAVAMDPTLAERPDE